MKLMKIAILGIAVVFAVASAQALGLGAFGAYWNTKDADDSYGYGAKIISTGDESGYLELRITRFDDISEKEKGDDVTLEVTPLEIGLTMMISSESGANVYIGGGGGYYMLESDLELADGTSVETDVDDEWGWYALAGLEIPMTDNLLLIGEAIYRQVEGTIKEDDPDLDNITDDYSLDLAGFGANVGVVFKF